MNQADLATRLRNLGIPGDAIERCQLPPQIETTHLVQSEDDIYGRRQLMTPTTLARWQQMKTAATKDGIGLVLVSAFRSIDYQCELIERKLAAGRSIEDILKVNTLPGYSEHHTGRALDLHYSHSDESDSGTGEPLTEAFGQSSAFDWLHRHAGTYDFSLSYPPDNTSGIAYEPWHWCCRG